MYRESDEICNEWDEAPPEIKDIKFRERWECLSKEASDQVSNNTKFPIKSIASIVRCTKLKFSKIRIKKFQTEDKFKVIKELFPSTDSVNMINYSLNHSGKLLIKVHLIIFNY